MRLLRQLLWAFVLITNLKAQKKVDSLRSVIKNSKVDSVKIIAYTQIAEEYFTMPKKALEVLLEMKDFCGDVKLDKDKALCLRKIGTIYGNLNYIDKALEVTFKAAELFEKANDKYGLAYCYSNIGLAYNYKGELTKDLMFQKRSIEYHLKSINLRDPLRDSIPLMNSYSNIGNSYMALMDYPTALNYFNKAHAMYMVAGEKKSLERININMGTCYLRIGLKENKAMYLNQSLHYFLMVIRNYNGNNPSSNYASVFANIGYVYSELGNPSLGISYLKRGVEMAKVLQDKNAIMDAARKLSSAYEKSGDYKKAVELMHLYNTNKDSLVNERNSSNTEELQTLYQSSKKDKEIDKLSNEKALRDSELSKQRTIIFSVVGAIISILVLGLVLLSRYNLKRKANLELQKAYRKIESKNRQITDSINYAKRIQSAILPPVSLLEEQLKNFFVYYNPKDIVSGDFFWFAFKNEMQFIAVVDCTGHGIPGALMSMIGNTLLNEIVVQKNVVDPGEILIQLNNGVKDALRQGGGDYTSQDDGMDISLCLIDKRNPNSLKYACASHSIFIKEKGVVNEHSGDIYSIGGDFNSEDKIFKTHEISVSPGAKVILSTDGYYDQFGGSKDSKFLMSRFEKLVNDTQIIDKSFVTVLENSMKTWKGDKKQTDDILVLGFEI